MLRVCLILTLKAFPRVYLRPLLIRQTHWVSRYFYCNTDTSSCLQLFLAASKDSSYNIDLRAHKIQSTGLSGSWQKDVTIPHFNLSQLQKKKSQPGAFLKKRCALSLRLTVSAITIVRWLTWPAFKIMVCFHYCVQ